MLWPGARDNLLDNFGGGGLPSLESPGRLEDSEWDSFAPCGSGAVVRVKSLAACCGTWR